MSNVTSINEHTEQLILLNDMRVTLNALKESCSWEIEGSLDEIDMLLRNLVRSRAVNIIETLDGDA